jgi:glutathione peroxidase-family protein
VEFLQDLQWNIVKFCLQRRSSIMKKFKILKKEILPTTAKILTDIAKAVASHYVIAILDLFV